MGSMIDTAHYDLVTQQSKVLQRFLDKDTSMYITESVKLQHFEATRTSGASIKDWVVVSITMSNQLPTCCRAKHHLRLMSPKARALHS